MPRFVLSAVFWIAFLDTSRAAIATWSAASAFAAEFGSAPIHVCLSLGLWLVAFTWFGLAVQHAWPTRS